MTKNIINMCRAAKLCGIKDGFSTFALLTLLAAWNVNDTLSDDEFAAWFLRLENEARRIWEDDIKSDYENAGTIVSAKVVELRKKLDLPPIEEKG